MRTSTKSRLLILLLAILLVIVACRRGREEPPTPTAEVPVATEAAAAPTAEPAPPTREPAPIPVSGIDPAAIDWAPQVVSVSPPPGADLAVNEPLTIRFDQPMDQTSVEAAFTLDPAVDGDLAWADAQTIVFTPAQPLDLDQSYSVRVANTAASLNGQQLPEGVAIDWQTVGPLLATQFGPADSAVGVPLEAVITVAFNQPVVPLVTTGDQASLPQPLIIEPAVSGRGEWTTTSLYRFIPDGSLAGGTRYSVTVDSALQSISGATPAETLSWQFTTLSPEVVSIIPEHEAERISPTGVVTITFSAPMNRAATEAAASISGPGGAIPVDYVWAEGDHVLGLRPTQPMALETEHTVTVSSSATAAAGGAAMADAWRSTFTTVPLPAVDSVYPEDGRTADRWQRGVNISFVSPMNPETLEDRLIIEPQPEDVDYFYNEWEGQSSIYLDFTLEADTQYRVTIPADAADPYGNTLGEAYTWTFFGPPPQPVASFNLPSGIAQLSTSFPTEVGVIHNNLSEMTVALYAQSLDVGLLFDIYQVNETQPEGSPLREWPLSLAPAEGGFDLATISLADGGVLPTGIYRLGVKSPQLESDSRYWMNQNVYIAVSDTNIVVKEMFGKVHVWVTDLATGQPAAGRSLTLYNRKGALAGTAVSDAAGFASFDYEPADDYLDGVMVVSNAPGQPGFGIANSNWSGAASPWSMGVNYDTGREMPIFAYIYTDRPIYRPGDTVYYKGIVRSTNFGRYALPDITELEIAIAPQFFTGDDSSEKRFTVQVDETGAFTGEYLLDEGMMLGDYGISIPGGYYSSYRSFTVAEYRKPEFSVELTADRTEALRGEVVVVTLNAAYLFGAPASDLKVNWTAYDKAFQPQFNTPQPYSFGDYAGYFYVDYGPFGGGGGGELGIFRLSGEGTTDAQGRLVITLPAELLAESEAGSREVTVEATVGGIGEFPISSRTGVVFHAAETYVGIRLDDYLVNVNTEAAFDLLTVDWDGNPTPNAAAEVVFYQREWERERVSDYGMYQTKWTPVDTEVARESVTTDGTGEAAVSFTPTSGGTYLAVATVTDGRGRQQTSSTTIWVMEPGYYGWRTDPNQRTMELTLDKEQYRVGETARVLVQSPFAQPVQAWLVIERGAIIEQRVVTVSSAGMIDIPVTADMAPNVHLSIIAIKPVDSDPAFPFADIRLGITELVVDPEQLTLDVVLSPAQSSYGPGDTATYDITVTNYLGNPITADVSLSLVDLAVLLLKDDNAPPIDEAFYTPQPLRSRTGSGLFITGEGLEPEVPLMGGGMGGGGGDMAAMESARLPEEPEGVRQDFKDTAYWEASLSVAGSTTVEIPLPDNLTTWRLSSKAVADGTLVGQSSTDIQVQLPLQVRPVTPRFFTVGDALRLGTNVDNNTDQAIEASVTLLSTGLTLEGEAEQTVNVPARGRAFVTWNVTVQDVQYADLTFSVEGGGYKDASKPTVGSAIDGLLPVYRYNGRDFVATAGELDEAGRRVEAIVLPQGVDPMQGQVTVSLQPSLAAALLESFTAYTEPQPYETNCAHVYADRILLNTATQKAIEELQLGQEAMLAEITGQTEADVDRLQALVRSDGGWAWCYSEDTDPWLSAFSLLSLTRAQALGYSINGEIVARAGAYLDQQLLRDSEIGNAYETNRQAFFLYVLAETDRFPAEDADSLISEHRPLLDPYAKALLALAYDSAGAAGPNQAAMLSDLSDSVIMSATGAHWEDAETDYLNLSSDIRGTAMVVDALATLQPESPLLPPAVRWLMVARRAQTWSTTHETAWAITGLSDWMVASGELEADYAYQLNVNLVPQTSGTFTSENLTGSGVVEVPVGDLSTEGLNYFDFQRQAGPGRLYYTLQLDSSIAVSAIQPVSHGMTVSRRYFDAACNPETETCEPISQIAAGQRVRVEMTVVLPEDRLFVVIEDPIPAGTEAIDPNLLTSAANTGGSMIPAEGDYGYGWWGWWYFDHIQYGDEKVVFLSQFLPSGTYQYTYYLDAVIPGTFQVMPTTAREQFFPEVFGRAEGNLFTITAE